MMFGGTSGAESQSPESYCTVANVKVVIATIPRALPSRTPRRLDALDGDARRDAPRTHESVRGVVARAERIDRWCERTRERGCALERVDAEGEQRIDRGARVHREIIQRGIEALGAPLGRAVERGARDARR